MRSITGFALCALTIATAGACTGSPAPAANSHGAPYFINPDTATAIAGTTLTVDFGRVRLGNALTRELVIGNRGAGRFTVTAIARSEAFPAAFEIADTPFGVEPASEHRLAVTFRPSVGGEPSGSLRLIIENSEPSELGVELRAVATLRGESPELDFAPTNLDFGEVKVGFLQRRKLVLANVGADVPNTIGDNLSLVARTETGEWVARIPEILGADAVQFRVEWPPDGYGPAGLAQGETVEISVRFLPTTEGDASATLVIFTNDGARPRVEVPLTGKGISAEPCRFEISPQPLPFGVLQAYSSLTQTITFRNLDPEAANSCLVSLDLTKATRQAGAFALVDGPMVEEVIPGGGTVVIPIRFQPEFEGEYDGELSIIVFNSPQPEAQVSVVLAGAAAPPCLMIAPRVLDFGDISEWCSSRERTFTMYNTCDKSIQIEAIGLKGDSATGFQISRTAALPSMIVGGGSQEFAVRYRPVDQGEDSDAIEVRVTSGAYAYSLVVDVSGTGVDSPIQTDVYSTTELPKADILMVIDNSPTMADKQASLAANLDSFINWLAQECVDYHLAVTTTDVSAAGEAGRLLPLLGSNPRVITQTTANAVQLFDQNSNVGTSGSETESLLRPVYLALTDPLIDGHNAGFFRDDAILSVIVISDAADQDPTGSAVDFYESFLLNLKCTRRSCNVRFSAIVPTMAQAPTGCSYDTASAGLDPRVRTLVQRVGGVLGEICDANWAQSLRQVGTSVRGSWSCSITELYLSNPPDMSRADPIAVTVDGQNVAQYDPSGAQRWNFDSAGNKLVFNPPFAPTHGTPVTISYHVTCR